MQLDFDNKQKWEIAVDRIINFYEQGNPYLLSYSGGKDSDCALKLCQMAKEKASHIEYEVHFSMTGLDPKPITDHVKTISDIIIDRPKESIFKAIEHKGMPTRRSRWCCDLLKEQVGAGRFLITGIRAEESIKRAKRGMVQNCIKGKGKKFLHPIIDWTEKDVWQFIKEFNIPYCELYDKGWKRIGCIGCPLSSHRDFEFEQYPKFKEAWYRACCRYYENRKDRLTARSSDELWYWWMHDESIVDIVNDLPMFV